MTDLIFVDTETTGPSPDDDIWEFAGIRRSPGVPDAVLHIQIGHDVSKAAKLPEQFAADYRARFKPDASLRQRDAAWKINAFMAPAADGAPPHLVGVNPAFDAGLIARLLRRNGILEPPWHYHLLDVPAVALGVLVGRGAVGLAEPRIPWRSDDLAFASGLPQTDHVRHTAMGDARWAMDWWDVLVPAEAVA